MYLLKNISQSKFSVQAQNIDLVAFLVHRNLLVTDNYYGNFFWHVSLKSVTGLFSPTSLTLLCKLITRYRLKSPTMLFAQRILPKSGFWNLTVEFLGRVYWIVQSQMKTMPPRTAPRQKWIFNLAATYAIDEICSLHRRSVPSASYLQLLHEVE